MTFNLWLIEVMSLKDNNPILLKDIKQSGKQTDEKSTTTRFFNMYTQTYYCLVRHGYYHDLILICHVYTSYITKVDIK